MAGGRVFTLTLCALLFASTALLEVATADACNATNTTKVPAVHARAHMTWRSWLTLATIIVVLLVLSFQLMSVAAALIGSAVFLYVCGVIPAVDIFVGLNNAGVLAVGLMFIIMGPISKLPAVRSLVRFSLTGQGVRWPMLKVCALSMFFSPWLDPIPQVAMTVPLIKTFALELGLAPSMFLMPMDFAVLVSNYAVTGASNNLVVSGLMQSAYGKGMSFFEPIKVSAVPSVFALFYLVIFAPLLLPTNRGGMFYLVKEKGRDFLLQIRIRSDSPLVGRESDSLIAHFPGVSEGSVRMIELIRGNSQLHQFSGKEVFQAGDTLVLAGAVAAVTPSLAELGLEFHSEHLSQAAAGARATAVPSASSEPTAAEEENHEPVELSTRHENGTPVEAHHRHGAVVIDGEVAEPVESEGGDTEDEDVKSNQSVVGDPELTNASFIMKHTTGGTALFPNNRSFGGPASPPAPVRTFSSVSKGSQTRMYEVIVSGFCPCVGTSLSDHAFFARYGCTVIAARTGLRNQDLLGAAMSEHVLMTGDTLLILGTDAFESTWRGSSDFTTINTYSGSAPPAARDSWFTFPWFFPFGKEMGQGKNRTKVIKVPWWYEYLTLGAFVGAVVAAICGIDLYAACIVAVCGLVIVGVLDTYKAIALVDWNAWIIVAFSFGIGKAVTESGLAAVIGQGIVDGDVKGFPLLLVIGLVTMALANIVTNKAAIQVMFPVVFQIYSISGRDPTPGLMVLSAISVMPMCTPHGIPANVLIVGPGGYSPLDFLKFGGPLNVMMVLLHCVMASAVYKDW